MGSRSTPIAASIAVQVINRALKEDKGTAEKLN